MTERGRSHRGSDDRRAALRLGLPTIASAAWDDVQVVTGHFGEVRSTAMVDGRTRWRIATDAAVDGVAVSGQGIVAFATRDGRLSASDPAGHTLWSLDGTEPVHLCILHDRLAVARSTHLVVLDIATGLEVAQFEAPSAPRRLRWAPDGAGLVLACTDGTVHVVDARSGAIHYSLRLPDGPAWDAAVASGTGQLAIAGRALYFAEDGAPTTVVPLDSPARLVAWSPDGQTLAVGTQKGGIGQFDSAGAALGRVLEATREVLELAWDPSGLRWATGCRATMGTSVAVAGSALHVGALREGYAVVTPSGVATFDRDGAIMGQLALDEPVRGARVTSWSVDVHTAHRVARSGPDGFDRPLPVPLPAAIAFGPADQVATVAVGSNAPGDPRTLLLQIWNARTSEPSQMAIRAPLEPVDQIALNPDGHWIAARSASHVFVWSTSDGQCLAQLDDVQPSSRGLRFGAAEGRIVSAMRGGTVHLWGPSTVPRVLATGEVTALTLDASGDRLVVGIRSARHAAVQTWNTLSGGKICAALPDVEGHVRAVTCSRGAMRVAALIVEGGRSKMIVWDGLFGRTLARGQTDHALTTLALSEDGARLVVGADDGTVRAWSLEGLPDDEDHVTTLVGSN